MMVMIINMPGIVKYGAYHGFAVALAFLTSAKNQLPSNTAARRIGIALRTVINNSLLLSTKLNSGTAQADRTQLSQID